MQKVSNSGTSSCR